MLVGAHPHSADESRVVVFLKGGVGNQLFQIANGLSFADALAACLEFDLSFFNADPYKRRPVLRTLFPDLRLLSRPISRDRTIFIREKALEERELFPIATDLKPGQSIYLDGYWQDLAVIPSYFRAMLIKRLISCVDGATLRTYEQVRGQPDSIGIHLRRTDYAHHGLVKLDFYRSLVSKIRKLKPMPSVYIFSEEPNFAEYFFAGLSPKVLISVGRPPVDDLLLLSACKTVVMANSTFSWWGAYLSDAKTVFYPLPWSHIATPRLGFFPKSWRGINRALESEEQKETFCFHGFE